MRRLLLLLAFALAHGAAAADVKPVAANEELAHWRDLVAASAKPGSSHFATGELVHAVTRVPGPQALSILALCQEQPHPSLIPVVAGALQSDDPGVQAKALRVLRVVGIADLHQAERVTELIAAPHPLVAATAIDTAASLKLENSVPALLKTAASEDRSLARSSFAGLTRISGQALPDAVEPWQQWYDHQQTRINEALPRIHRDLAANEPRQVIAAMQELVSLPLISSTTVLTLTNLENHANPQIRQLATHLLDALTDAKTGNTGAILARAQGGTAGFDAFSTEAWTTSPASLTTASTASADPLHPTGPSGNRWSRIAVLVSLLALALIAILWLLRTPTARAVKTHMGHRIRHITGEISAIRHVADRVSAIRKATSEVNAIHKVELGTRRLVRPVIRSMHRQ